MSQKIRVMIAGRYYPITVGEESEEEIVRIASKNIEEFINNIETKYSIGDKQDALAMVAIQYATKYEAQKKSINKTFSSTMNKIEELNVLLADSLENKSQ